MTDDCRKCIHCEPNNNLLRNFDWYCKKFKRIMMIRNIGCGFSCDEFEEAKE